MTSSTNIEKEITQMVLDVREFHKGTKQTLEDIGSIKKSMDFSNAQKSFGEFEKASKIDFSQLGKGISAINSKISLAGVAAATAVANITSSVIGGAKQLFNSLVLTPITTGFQEYETQLNAVQTILANTAKHGTDLDDVTQALDELNLYADKTIYNFTQMTDSIGKFTTAGVDLETSVSAIKGIANVAAVSGSNANQASTAMYQLSQAISSGVVRLQDWISVENAGMGGEAFRDSLIETARLHDEHIDLILEREGGFRNSLKEGWLTSDILLQTLAKFTGDLTDEQLLAYGYTEKQVVAIQKMAQTASDAATKIKTLSQFKDTLSEALQSGWSETWRIIFGDFEEAKELWGALEEVFGGIIKRSSDSRNKMLDFWKAAGGRQDLITGVFNVIEGVSNILNGFKEAVSDVFEPLKAGDLLTITKRFLNFSENLKMASGNLDTFKSIVRGFAAAFDIVRLVIVAILSPLRDLISDLSPAAGSFFETAASIGDSIVAFREFAIETGYFDNIVAKIIAKIGEFVDQAKALVDSLLELEVVKDVTDWLDGLEREDFVKVWEGIIKVLQAVATPFVILALGAKQLYVELSKLEIIQNITKQFQAISWQGIKDAFVEMGEGIENIVNSVKNSELLGKFVDYFKTFDGRRIREFLEEGRENFAWLGDIIEKITDSLGGLGKEADSVGEGIGDIFESIGEGLSGVLDYLIENAGNINYERFFDVVNAGLLSGVLLSLRKVFKGGWLEDALGSFFGEDSAIGGSISGMFETMEGTLVSFQNNIKADTLQKIAIAIALLAGSLVLLTFVDSEKLLAASGAIVLMVGALFGSAGALGNINTRDALKAAAAIVGLSLAIAIVSVAMKNISDLSPEQLEQSLIGIGLGLAALVASIHGLSADTGFAKTVLGLIGLGLALAVLGIAINKFGQMDPDVLAQGLAAVAASLALLVTSTAILSQTGAKGMIKAALGITIMSAALLILATAVMRFGEMDPDVMTQGLLTAGAALVGFAIFSRIVQPKGLIAASIGITVMSAALLVMSKAVQSFGLISWDELIRGLVGMGVALLLMVLAANAMTGALAGAAAMLVMSIAVLALGAALKLIASLSWEDLLKALVGLAAIFLILGVAGALLTPVVPTLLLLGAAMLLIGLGAALMGAGLLLASIGLIAIAGSAAAIAAAIGLVGGAIIELLPKLGQSIAEAIVGFIVTIGEAAPEIIDAFKNIVLELLYAVSDLIPTMVVVILDMVDAILGAIAERLPDIIQAGFDILLGILKGIEENIAEVVTTAINIITEFINGIAEAIPDLVDAGFNLILTFLNAIADGIEEYMDDIIAAGKRIGEGIIEGLVKAIGDGLSEVWSAIWNLAQSALSWLKDAFSEDSPSKETYEIGRYAVLGFVNSIKDGVKDVKTAFTRFANEAKSGIEPIMRKVSEEVERSMDFSPVISPILDLDSVIEGFGTINSQIENASVLADVSFREGRVTREVSPLGKGDSSSQQVVEFNQYNYSPKALDREAIYRQTKTQVARAAALG